MKVRRLLLLPLLALTSGGCGSSGCPEEVPDWIPIYPGMTIERTTFDDEVACEHTIDARSEDPVDEIREFYLTYLRERSWKIRDLTDREIAERFDGIDPRRARGIYSQKIFPNRTLCAILARAGGVTRIRLISRMP